MCPEQKQLHYDILLLAHTVEKGLSVANTRPGFGKEKISRLLELLLNYDENWDAFALEKSYGCLSQYLSWHKSIGYDLVELEEPISNFIKRCIGLGLNPRGGTKQIVNAANVENPVLQDALMSRFSCRRFEPVLVSECNLQKISLIAARTPSQCNRQSSRVHYFSDKAKILELLSLQGGAGGFLDSVYNLFIVTSDISAWSGYKARSQAYVDGALTAMQVLNACQATGLGCCPLNLAVTNAKEKVICDAAGISRGERLIMMIAFGVPEAIDLSVARSERKPSSQVLIRH